LSRPEAELIFEAKVMKALKIKKCLLEKLKVEDQEHLRCC